MPLSHGTLPAALKIAGEGTMDSHAFEYLTELSDEVGARVTKEGEYDTLKSFALWPFGELGAEPSTTN